MAPQAEAAAYASSGSSESDRDESWDDYSADGDEQQQPATSLFEQKHFPSAQQALQHDRDQHGVDLPLLCATLGEPFQPGWGIDQAKLTRSDRTQIFSSVSASSTGSEQP